jgi:hypothetical protein
LASQIAGGAQACAFGAGGRRCTWRRSSATQSWRWRWSRRARTCTARPPTGTVLGLDPHVVGLPQCGGGRSVDSALERQESRFGLCRCTALHLASDRGNTKTAMALVKAGTDVHCKDNDGYGSSCRILVTLACHSAGEDDPSTPGWGCKGGCFGCAGGRYCTMRRRTATRKRRWRLSGPARTCTARKTMGTVLALHPADIG